ELVGLRARETDAHQCAFEVTTVAGGLDWHEGAADPWRRRPELEAKLGEDTAQFSRFALIVLLHLTQRRDLPTLDAIERSFDAVELAIDGDLRAALAVRWRHGRVEQRAVVVAAGWDQCVADRRNSSVGRLSAPRGAADRAGRDRIADAAERCRVR